MKRPCGLARRPLPFSCPPLLKRSKLVHNSKPSKAVSIPLPRKNEWGSNILALLSSSSVGGSISTRSSATLRSQPQFSRIPRQRRVPAALHRVVACEHQLAVALLQNPLGGDYGGYPGRRGRSRRAPPRPAGTAGGRSGSLCPAPPRYVGRAARTHQEQLQLRDAVELMLPKRSTWPAPSGADTAVALGADQRAQHIVDVGQHAALWHVAQVEDEGVGGLRAVAVEARPRLSGRCRGPPLAGRSRQARRQGSRRPPRRVWSGIPLSALSRR